MKTPSTYIHQICKNKKLQLFIYRCKSLSLPGFKGVAIYDVLYFLYSEVGVDSIQTRAAATAFHVLLALFPAILFFFSLVAYIPVSEFRETVFEFLSHVLPFSTQQWVYDLIDNTATFESNSLWAALFNLLLSLYFASNGIRSLMIAFRKLENPAFEERHFFERQMLSIGLTILLNIIFVLTVIGIIVGKAIIGMLIASLQEVSWLKILLLQFLRLLMVFFLTFFSISTIYALVPATKQRWQYFSPGAITVSILSIVASGIFLWFVNTFGSYNKIYGSLGALIVIMIWFHFIAYLLIAGFELNVYLLRDKRLMPRIAKGMAWWQANPDNDLTKEKTEYIHTRNEGQEVGDVL